MLSVRVRATAELPADGLLALRRLLDAAFEGDFAAEDWEHAVGGWHVLVSDGEALVAHAAVVARTLWVGDRRLVAGYLEGVGTAPAHQGRGLGSLAVVQASALVRDTFELGALSTGRHRFYQRLGWERWRGPTFVRDGGHRRRTEEDDDGVMVLRSGPGTGVDLGAALTCEAREGDDW